MRPTGPPAPGTPITLPVIVYTCRNTSMAAFAGGMLSMAGAGQYFNNKLVVDQTELKGVLGFQFPVYAEDSSRYRDHRREHSDF